MSRLLEILEWKRQEVEANRTRQSLSEYQTLASKSGSTRGFRAALENASGKPALIAEVKAASPSQGEIRPDLNAAEVALIYQSAGAHCLSVLTDSRYFRGSNENLLTAREAVSIPVLRKEFIVDEYQVFESRVLGADAVLLIVAALDDAELAGFREVAEDLDMDVLVEVHSEAELERALTSGANIIGVNNRDLSTFETDLAVSERLIPMIGYGRLAVSESALSAHEDVKRVTGAGASAVLIGTTFCAAHDVGAKVREVMGW